MNVGNRGHEEGGGEANDLPGSGGEGQAEAETEAGRIHEDDPRLALVHLLRAAVVEFDLLGAEFATRNGLHPTDVRALIELLDARRAGIAATPGWLGGRLGLNSAAVTALVDRLERLDLVHRARGTRDRRKVLLTVSASAGELGWSFFGPLIARIVATLDEFGPEEIDAIRRFLGAAGQAVAEVRRGHSEPRQARVQVRPQARVPDVDQSS